jgi:hypothetical protein
MGEIQNQSFQLSFNASLKVDFQGSRVTSDGGPAGRDAGTRRATRVRRIDRTTRRGGTDSRRGKNTQFPFADPAEWDGNRSIVAWLVTKTSTTPSG